MLLEIKMNKDIFKDFLKNNYPEKESEVLSLFEEYHDILLELNKSVNLVSRRTLAEDIWTRHFLDSLLPLKFINLSNQKILDFGTGGGMPGIPLKIMFPTSMVYLLDSRRKKIEAVKKMIKKLDLSECFTIVSRLEELKSVWYGFFDVIVCRSVKILPNYKKFLLQLLKEDGEILLYKGKIFEESDIFPRNNLIDISHPAIGERKLIQIKKKWEGYE
jgi:16S rRNA (guanine527-N7)-methyltransferase